MCELLLPIYHGVPLGMDSKRRQRLYALARLTLPQEDNSGILDEINRMIEHVLDLKIDENAPIWLGVSGPKRCRQDEYREVVGQNFASLAAKSHKRVVFAPRAINKKPASQPYV